MKVINSFHNKQIFNLLRNKQDVKIYNIKLKSCEPLVLTCERVERYVNMNIEHMPYKHMNGYS